MHRSEIADGMRIDWNVPVKMADGVVLRADIFRPLEDGQYPAILSYGPYGKGLAFQDGFPGAWRRLIEDFPEVAEGTSGKYLVFELVDPEKWVPDGYACVRFDSRGAGCSEGFLDPKSIQETHDLRACIEWAAVQPWCDGQVGLNGISYYATNAWYVASMAPPHLAAICAWEGAADYYRENCRHGGILCQFLEQLYPHTVWRVQHGVGERGPRSRANGEPVAGPETLAEEDLARNRIDIASSLLAHPFDDDYYSGRSAKWSAVTVPLLSAANWGGHGLHARGNFEGFMRAASEHKWLEVHGDTHWTHFYTDYGVTLQKRFFAHFLKGEDASWDRKPRVQLQVRHLDCFVERHEDEWPIARTEWTRFYLHLNDQTLSRSPSVEPSAIAYNPAGDGVTFLSPPFATETEVTGPVAAKLFVSSASCDADLFVVLRLFAPDGREVTFQGANDSFSPVALGWLRASHRKLDPELSLPFRPYHSHDEAWLLEPGVPVELDVEIWPTSIVVPPGYSLGLTVRGKDYHYEGPSVEIPGIWFKMTGIGPFRHDHPQDRPPDVFSAEVTMHADADRQPYVLLPVIPAK